MKVGKLRKLLMLMALLPLLTWAGTTYTERIDGQEWTYDVADGEASVTRCVRVYGLPQFGTIDVPSALGGVPVTGIRNYAFLDCERMMGVRIPESVTNIRRDAFRSCGYLTEIVVADDNTCYSSLNGILYDKAVTELVRCPEGMTGEVTIPSSVTNIGSCAFSDCDIVSVAIPSGVTSIGESAFSYCRELTSVMISSSVTNIRYGAFNGCPKLTSFVVDSENPAYSSGNDLLLSKDGRMVVAGVNGDVTIPAGVVNIGDDAFYGYGCLWSVTIPSGVTSIGAGAFSQCSSLRSVTIPPSVTNIGEEAFYNCSRLTSVTIPEGVTSIGAGAFSDCDGLTSVTIPSSVTDIGNCAFSGCHLASATISAGVMSIGESAFYDCFYLKSVAIPSSVTSIGYGAFERCLSLDVIYCDDECDHVAMNRMLSESGFDVTKVKFAHCLVPGETTEIETGLVGYKATGLPSGLKYDAKTGKITGAATKPTAADGVAAKFTKSGEADVALTFVVGPLPTLKVEKEGDVDGCKVTGEGAYLAGKKVTLKVTTPKGTAFLGYYKGEEPWPNESDYKKTSLSYVMTRDDESVVARFEKEKMSVGCTGLEGYFVAGVAGAAEGIPLQIETQSGVKSVKVTKLPAGMKYDSKTGRITGAPTKVENPTVVIEVTAVSGAVEKKEIPVRVIASNEKAVGLFSGFATKDSLQDFNRVGTILLTTTAEGKLTTKVVTKKGSLSFSAASWDGIRDSHYENDGVYFVTMKTKKGEELALELDTRASVGIGANQLTGWLKGVDTEGLRIGAQHVVFGQPWYFTASGDEALGWKLSYTADKKAAALTVTFKADGSVTIAGKLGTYEVSASRYANVSDLPSELLRADFAVVVKVGKESRVMNVNTNLRFDRTYVTDEAGEAAFAE